MVLGRAAPEEIAQLLDHNRQARRLSAHDGRLGSLAGRTFPLQHRQQVTEGAQPGAEPECVVCTEHAKEAVIVEGVAEIADVAARRKFLPPYERKYKFDMSSMKADILAMKEPVFDPVVR